MSTAHTKALKIKLGDKAKKEFAYKVTDIGSGKEKYHGHEEGIKKLKNK